MWGFKNTQPPQKPCCQCAHGHNEDIGWLKNRNAELKRMVNAYSEDAASVRKRIGEMSKRAEDAEASLTYLRGLARDLKDALDAKDILIGALKENNNA